MKPKFDTILLTGAAGRLGTQLRRGLAPLARRLRVSDRVEIKDLQANEEAFICDLADFDAVLEMTKGVDAIVHFGGVPMEDKWQAILDSNIRGGYHIYEGARKNGVKRIVFASSVHAIGYHRLEDNIDATAPHRPDSLYGVSKCFVEDLARLYWDKFGIETVCARIFSSFEQYSDRRHLWSMLTFDDCVRLVTASLTAPRVAHSIIFGTSNNRNRVIDNRLAGHIGFQPQDSTEPHREEVEERIPPVDPRSPEGQFLGGFLVNMGHPDDEKN